MRRNPEEKLGRLLEAGYAVFVKRGYHGASIQEICARAKVSVGSFYTHFEHKREIIARLLQREARERLAVLVRFDFADRDALAVQLDGLLNDPAVSGFWRAWREAVAEDPQLQVIDRRVRSDAIARVAVAIERSRAASGSASTIGARTAAWAIVGLVRQSLTNPQDRPDIPEVAEAIRTLAVPGGVSASAHIAVSRTARAK